MTELEMFTKLPKFDGDYEASDIGDYLPTLTLADSLNKQYTVCWIEKYTSRILDVYFTASTPEEAIRNAYKWCNIK
jgi:hypothetical protein